MAFGKKTEKGLSNEDLDDTKTSQYKMLNQTYGHANQSQAAISIVVSNHEKNLVPKVFEPGQKFSLLMSKDFPEGGATPQNYIETPLELSTR